MQDLFSQVSPVIAPLFSVDFVAEQYGSDKKFNKQNKNRHSDEIVEPIHFVTELNAKNRPVIKWTLRGIIKLGMFIRSPQAKNFRLWAERELEKSINAELENARHAREKNLQLVNQIADCQTFIKKQAKQEKYRINGYRSQIVQHNTKINNLALQLDAEQARNYALQARCQALEVEVIEARTPSDELTQLKKELAELRRAKILWQIGENDSLLKHTRAERDNLRAANRELKERLAKLSEFLHKQGEASKLMGEFAFYGKPEFIQKLSQGEN